MTSQVYIREKNLINTRIKTLNILIERNKNTINKILSKTLQSEFEKKDIKNRENLNNNYIKEIEELKDRIIKLSNGLLDDEFIEKNMNVQKNISKNNDKLEKKNKDKIEKKLIEKKFIEKSYKLNENNNKYLENDYKNYCRLSNKIPSYVLRNLKEMPKNKGYIILDRNKNEIWCFGELEPEKNRPIVMFKKINDDILEIYEIDNKYISIYEKKGKGQKILKSKDLRN